MNVVKKQEDSVFVEHVSFLDTGKEFDIITQGDFKGVALRPIVEDMGLDWSAQLKKIKNHPILSKGVVFIATPSSGGTQETACLSIRRLPFYLATLNTKRIKNRSIRNRVELYQEYAADVIFEATYGQAFLEADVLQFQLEQQRKIVAEQSIELQHLRLQGSNLKVQGELFANADILPARAKVRGLLAAYSGKGISMAAICRHLKEETGFDAHKIRKKIQAMGGKATLLNVITAHKYDEKALGILCRMLR